MKNRETIINIFLLILIIGLGALVATSRYEAPQMPRYAVGTPTPISTGNESETTYTPTPRPEQPEEAYTHLGKQRLFRTLIPKPTQAPQPTRTPEPPPKLEVMIRHWKLNGVLKNTSIFTDQVKKEDFFLKEGEEKTVNYRGKDYLVKLASINTREFSVTLTFEDQTYTMKIF